MLRMSADVFMFLFPVRGSFHDGVFFPACVAGVIFNKVYVSTVFSTFGNKLQLSLLMRLYFL